MPIRHRYDPGMRTLFVTAEGEIGDDEFLAWGQQVAADEAIPAGRLELIDLRRLELPDVSSETLRRVADAFRQRDRTQFETKIAVVASSDLAFGLSRMYQAYRSDAPIALEVFRDMDAARAWLGLPPEAG